MEKLERIISDEDVTDMIISAVKIYHAVSDVVDIPPEAIPRVMDGIFNSVGMMRPKQSALQIPLNGMGELPQR